MEIMFTVPGEPRGKGRPRFSRTGHAYTDNAFVTVDVIAYLPIPKGATKTQATGMAEKTILPSRKPDVDNILKVVLDALNGVAYKDDARVHKTSCVKYYSAEPRLEVTIKAV